jgi:cob(I)alamin adenosyltransferase
MRITKVYTRTGDGGSTRLVGGIEVSKAHARICAYGTVDELNAILGLARTFGNHAKTTKKVATKLDEMLHRVQNHLFDVGAELATPPAALHPDSPRVGLETVRLLETWIDSLNEDLGPLTEFVLPGGGPVGAFFHQGRTVCRRAEREVVSFCNQDPAALEPNSQVVQYLNRLSDWLFVGGRWAAKQLGEPEFLWERER